MKVKPKLSIEEKRGNLKFPARGRLSREPSGPPLFDSTIGPQRLIETHRDSRLSKLLVLLDTRFTAQSIIRFCVDLVAWNA